MISKFLRLFKQEQGFELAYRAKAKIKNARQVLIKTLNEQIILLEKITETLPKSRYSESELAKVLIAASNYLQYLKMTSPKIGRKERILLEYLSRTTSKTSNFPYVSTKIVQELQLLPSDSAMIPVLHNDLLNVFVFLLYQIQGCKG